MDADKEPPRTKRPETRRPRPTPGANYNQKAAEVKTVSSRMTNFCLRRLFPPNVSADLLPSLPDVPATLHCCLSRLLCGECSGHLARSMREPAVPRGWLTSPDRAAQGPTACRVGKGTVAQALPGASRPPRCPLPTLPCQAISHYRWEAGPLSDNAHAHARTRTHASNRTRRLWLRFCPISPELQTGL